MKMHAYTLRQAAIKSFRNWRCYFCADFFESFHLDVRLAAFKRDRFLVMVEHERHVARQRKHFISANLRLIQFKTTS